MFSISVHPFRSAACGFDGIITVLGEDLIDETGVHRFGPVFRRRLSSWACFVIAVLIAECGQQGCAGHDSDQFDRRRWSPAPA
jgi:hypothetical protein